VSGAKVRHASRRRSDTVVSSGLPALVASSKAAANPSPVRLPNSLRTTRSVIDIWSSMALQRFPGKSDKAFQTRYRAESPHRSYDLENHEVLRSRRQSLLSSRAKRLPLKQARLGLLCHHPPARQRSFQLRGAIAFSRYDPHNEREPVSRPGTLGTGRRHNDQRPSAIGPPRVDLRGAIALRSLTSRHATA
jgi:hypothetical protein